MTYLRNLNCPNLSRKKKKAALSNRSLRSTNIHPEIATLLEVKRVFGNPRGAGSCPIAKAWPGLPDQLDSIALLPSLLCYLRKSNLVLRSGLLFF